MLVLRQTCADGCTVSMGISPSRLSRRTLDRSIIVPCTDHRRIGLQIRSHSRWFSLACLDRIMAHRCSCSPHRECARVSAIQLSRCCSCSSPPFFSVGYVHFQATKKPPTKGSTKHGRRIPLVGSRTTLRDCGVAPILSNRIVLNLM